jgi:hypothetical protein
MQKRVIPNMMSVIFSRIFTNSLMWLHANYKAKTEAVIDWEVRIR